MANEQADAGTGDIPFSCSADHEQDWQPYPVDPFSANMFKEKSELVVSHIQRIGCQPEKNCQSRSWSAEHGKKIKKKKCDGQTYIHN